MINIALHLCPCIKTKMNRRGTKIKYSVKPRTSSLLLNSLDKFEQYISTLVRSLYLFSAEDYTRHI